MEEESLLPASTKSEAMATKSNSTDPKLLAKQCHALIGAIAKKPQATKLLILARDSLKMYVNYKAKRKH